MLLRRAFPTFSRPLCARRAPALLSSSSSSSTPPSLSSPPFSSAALALAPPLQPQFVSRWSPFQQIVRGLKQYTPTVPEDGAFKSLTKPKYRYGLTDADVEELDDVGRRILSLETAARQDRRQADIAAAIDKCQRFPGDTGSSEVQVAVLSVKIRYLAEHLQTNRKDHHSRKGFVALTQKRRKLLLHLRRTDFETYKKILHLFEIRDVKYINRDI